MKKVCIFCDGACKGNPGPGGWAAILKYKDKKKIISGYLEHATNNIMELTAAIKSLQQLKEPCEVNIYTDSQYVKRGIMEWLQRWKERSWKNSQKKPVKNQALWKTLDALCRKHNVHWHWIKGHEGQPENEECDAIAKQEIEKNLAK
ncbi:MAG: ribonuclease HI [Candidatus Cloacimonadia bacterium]